MRQQAERLAEAAQEKPRIIAVTGGKGGVGTTTVAIHLAIVMARQARRVLLVDADPDRADVAVLCGVPADHDLTDLAARRRTLAEVMVPGPDGIFVVPGAGRAVTSDGTINRFHQRWIAAVSAAEEPFDYVVVDTGNGSARSVKVLWEAADLVLLVTTAELPSIIDAYASIKTLAERTAPPTIHTLINRVSEPAVAYDAHGRLARAVWRFLGFHLDSAGHLAVDEDLADTSIAGGCPAPAARRSRLSREVGQLARTLETATSDRARRRPSAEPTEAVADQGESGPEGDRSDLPRSGPKGASHKSDLSPLVCQLAGDEKN